MHHKRYTLRERYYSATLLTASDSFALEDVEFHHFLNVMRGKEGDLISLIDGQGGIADAKVLKVEKKRALLSFSDVFREPPSASPLILAQALPRLNRLDNIIEKATELGMTELWLFPGDRSERKVLSSAQMERLKHVCIAAIKQSGRLYLPKISFLSSLSHWLKPSVPLYFGDLNPKAPSFLHLLDKAPPAGGAIFCTGPESGFSEEEELSLKNLGAIGAKLHFNILRTDTASIAALSLMSAFLIDHN